VDAAAAGAAFAGGVAAGSLLYLAALDGECTVAADAAAAGAVLAGGPAAGSLLPSLCMAATRSLRV